MSGVTLVNFSHPLTDSQRGEIATALDRPLDHVIDVHAHFDPQQPYAPQAEALVVATGLDATAWQTDPIIVNLPSFNAIAALVLARLHGLMGHFPAIVRLRPVDGALPPVFEFAELIDLNAQRIRAADLVNHEGVTTISTTGSWAFVGQVVTWRSSMSGAARAILAWFRTIDFQWLNAGKIAGLAIVGTIIGDTAYQFLTQKFWNWNPWIIFGYIVLLGMAFVFASGLVPSLIDLLSPDQESSISEDMTPIDPRPALIVFVSARELQDGDKPVIKDLVAMKAIEKFLQPEQSPLRHVFLIHSEQSRPHAAAIKDYIEGLPRTPRVHAHMDGLEADFYSLRLTRDVTERALRRIGEEHIEPQDVVVDITGGTSVATAGAVLATLNEDVILASIPWVGAQLGEEMKQVSTRLVRRK